MGQLIVEVNGLPREAQQTEQARCSADPLDRLVMHNVPRIREGSETAKATFL